MYVCMYVCLFVYLAYTEATEVQVCIIYTAHLMH